MIDDIEKLMFKHFSTIPFHNLNLLYGQPDKGVIPGGTCSDKTLAFLSEARESGFNARLHTAYIGGKEIHRLIRTSINGRTYYADVGNGWPTLKLIPSDEDIAFSCYGMKYRTEVCNEWVRVFHKKRGIESLQLEIHKPPKKESEIYKQIESRFSSNIKYPFSTSLRFSLIVGNQFLFLRGNQLERYSNIEYSVSTLNKKEAANIISKLFKFDVKSYFY